MHFSVDHSVDFRGTCLIDSLLSWASLLEPFSYVSVDFPIDVPSTFLMFCCGLGLPFQHHFGIQNGSREPSDAKRSTLDFERRYNENQVFFALERARGHRKSLPETLSEICVVF